jgi:hypothetical protein
MTVIEINWDELTPQEAGRLLNAMDDYFDHNEPDDEDVAEYEHLEEIAHQEEGAPDE